jgi:hypothetical protein
MSAYLLLSFIYVEEEALKALMELFIHSGFLLLAEDMSVKKSDHNHFPQGQ